MTNEKKVQSPPRPIQRKGSKWDAAKRRNRHALLVTPDVKNVFNSVNRKHIVNTLGYKNLPVWMSSLLVDYLYDRIIMYETADGTLLEEGVHAGVPQGSVLGPVLWNLSYDKVLELTHPPPGSKTHWICR